MPFLDHFLASVTQRDRPKYFRRAHDVGLDPSSAALCAVNRLSSTSCVEFHDSFIWGKRLDRVKMRGIERDT